MTTRQHSSFAIVFILGLLAMLMPLSIDMYLPALPVISAQFGVPAGSTQMTLSTYILGFALGQLIYGPMADSFGRKPVVLGGTLVVGVAAFVGCVSMVSSNAMAVILDEFPHMAGTASSLAGTFRFGIGAIVGALLSLATFNSAWPMIWSIAFCATSSILFCLYASRPKKR
ncbi:MFS transporter [Escherichia coli]|uniref:MFS transporter n=1 Tax=Escherichia coli TaxID=562 RepID=UPI0018E18E30|nr:MFS transporter [Escherichia coli]MBI0788474.1 MFS transporter [Escherichia coli]HDJ0952562.1 MFS transporter [Escherichia coli]